MSDLPPESEARALLRQLMSEARTGTQPSFVATMGAAVELAGSALATLIAPSAAPERQDSVIARYACSVAQLNAAILSEPERADAQVSAAQDQMIDGVIAEDSERAHALTLSISALGIAGTAWLDAGGGDGALFSDPLARALAVAGAHAVVAATAPPQTLGDSPPREPAGRDPEDFKPAISALVDMIGEAEPTTWPAGLTDVMSRAGLAAETPRPEIAIRTYGQAVASCILQAPDGDKEQLGVRVGRVASQAWRDEVDGRSAFAASMAALAGAVRAAGERGVMDGSPEVLESLVRALGYAAVAEASFNMGDA
jgi:hypothetical protein